MEAKNYLIRVLKKIYHKTLKRKRQKLIGRNWDMNLPARMGRDFNRSILTGIPYKVRNDNTNILLCAIPKSASLYITQLLSITLGLKNHQIGFNEAGGMIYYPRLLAAKYTPGNTISIATRGRHLKPLTW